MALVERYCPNCGAAYAEGKAACAACGASLKVTRQLDEAKKMPVTPALRLSVHLQTLQLFNERYRIVRQVGLGGFGAVYEAADTWIPHKVAIKEIGLAGLSTQQVIEATGSFNREVQMLATLRHAGIPRIYEQLTDAAHWYLVMEFINGRTLEDVLAHAPGGRLPLKQVLTIGIQICEVLEYLHTRQPAVIFRDIKPANIMLTPTDNLYLIDFGVARRYQPGKARDTIAFGSPGYASPEQYGRAQTTPLSDIYSLGALLYYLLTGDDPSDHPFHFPPLRIPGVEGIREIDALIQRMVAPDPAQRPHYASAELRHIQRLHLQSLTRAPIWIPPRGQTPPNMLAPVRGSQFSQTATASAPIWIPPQGQTPPGMISPASARQPQNMSVPVKSASQGQPLPVATAAASAAPQQPIKQAPLAPVQGQKTPGVLAATGGGQQRQQRVFAPPAPVQQHQQIVVASPVSATSGVGQQRQQRVFAPPAPTQQKQQRVVSSPAPTQQKQSARKTPRRHVLLGGLIAGGALLTGGLGVAWLNSRNAPVATSEPAFSSATVVPQDAQAAASASSPKPLVPPDGPTYWSPNLRYAVVDNTANLLEIYAAHPQKLLYTIPQTYSGAKIWWAADNRTFFFTPDNSVWNAQTGKRVYKLSPSLDQAFAAPGYVAWSPNGRYIVGSTCYLRETQMALLDATTGKALLQTTQEGYNVANCIAWSPDSRYIAFPDTDNSTWIAEHPWSVAIMEARTSKIVGTLSEIIPAAQYASSYASVSGIAWSPDGQLIAVVIEDHAWLCTLSPDLEVLETTFISVPSKGVPLWSPDSRWLAVFSSNGLSVYDTWASRTTLLSTNEPPSLVAAAWSEDGNSITSIDINNFAYTWKV